MAGIASALKGIWPLGPIGRIVKTKKFLKFLGADNVQVVDSFINNNVMVKLRQRECRNQKPAPSTADYLKTHFCAEPFQTLETTHTGLAFVCCPVWLPTPIGTLQTEPEDLWNGPVAKDIRSSIIDGSFRHCNHLHCPAITNRTLPERTSAEARKHIEQFQSATPPSLPTKVNLSHDKSCNLSCPSCRTDLYLANKSKQAELDKLSDRFVLPLLKNARTVMITGSGDPFGSNHFRNLIKKLTKDEFPNLRFDLITNGQLMNQKAWDELALAGRVDNTHISVDATTPETYKIVRRGGTFQRLLDNLAFIKQLRQSGDIKSLEFSMVVQSLNFREMPAFIDLAREYGADGVHFQMIRQRDIFSGGEHKVAFIGDPRHEDHAEFLRVINSDALRHPRAGDKPLHIELGNVIAYVQ